MTAPDHDRPATYREVFSHFEFRVVYGAVALSNLADPMAKAAITLLVFQRTGSVALSALAFAVSYLPWLIGGPLLSTLADRYPYRTVIGVTLVFRAALFGVVALFHWPGGVLVAALFLSTLSAAPEQAARSALLPRVLPRDRLVVGLSLVGGLNQITQIVGYVVGAGLTAISSQLVLCITATLFAGAAAIVLIGLRGWAGTGSDQRGGTLLSGMGQGFGLVFGRPELRSIAILLFCAMFFVAVPEGLAAAWASELVDDDERGIAQGLIMAATPLGFVAGSLIVGRLVRPSRRRALIRPFAIVAPLTLVPAVLEPSVALVVLMVAACGFAVGGVLPPAQGLFAVVVPDGFRARAYGVMQTGVTLMQGAGVALTGLLAERFPLPGVVSSWSLAGVLVMVAVSLRWPSAQRFDAAIAAAADREPQPGRV
ncbi:MFS transporter [Catenuloplanes atrovinosus]|uniref:MFS family permease n=1 Tax=Catenuloplanes atrovinosus TaxID=137266 RepID=A0AAE3YT43_9ACTN|nr:MFS transporter [Catenuloplanes atrovinosus]MDR7278752.1 MFS family permease [Catenuloplanes atrovinosus]